ncbi:Fanconi anemia group B protein isoform X1 [Erpetoichthys calabaricus]|uniref:Fanconi anemia group B protein isoform X1 n=1 Tax=Erpetoichthys calabaricus TaxID=27687 RepID=UPI0022348EAD|nr:Fanconi anemia group B protein isoform X1 [Erpetoichthys calabaricus]XP_028656686.2 Fanconi anemia group B protein isoform X1 [Erpetoichthys calabaricus]XP_028656687.2 Fanconi anemia group B protein isoform X1 [Erpetoichthys calabaricus]
MSGEDRVQCVSHAFLGEILSFKMVQAQIMSGKGERKSDLHFKRKTFSQEESKFVCTSEGNATFCSHSMVTTEIVCFSTVTVLENGLSEPCILLKHNSKKRTNFKYSLLLFHCTNILEPCLEFKLQYEVTDNVTVLNGPTVLWTHGNNVYCVSSKSNIISIIPVSFSSVKFIGEIKTKGIAIVGVRECTAEEEHDSQSDQAVWGNELIVYFLESQSIFDGALFLPHAYSAVVTNLLILTAEGTEDNLETSVVAATSKNQLIFFEGGTPKKVCQLPFDGPIDIRQATTGRNEVLFVVAFTSGKVCAVRKECWQVVSSWQNVQAIHIDDFACCGSDQILLIFENSSVIEDNLENFTLTDVCEITFTSNSENCNLSIDNTLQENYFITMQALEARLQSGLVLTEELQKQLEVKDQILMKSSKALMNLVYGQEYSLSDTEEERLVSLWDEERCSQSSSSEILSVPKKIPDLVDKVWQRVIGDSWVVGVNLKDAAYLSLDDISLSLLMGNDISTAPPVIQWNSNMLHFSNILPFVSFRPCQAEPNPKRKRFEPSAAFSGSAYDERSFSQIQKSEKWAVIAVTDLSHFLAFGSQTCTVLLHATLKENPQGGWKGGDRIVFQCSTIHFSMEDVALGRYLPKHMMNSELLTGEAFEDFYSIMAVSKKWCFQIISYNHMLTDLTQWFSQAMKCEKLSLNPDYYIHTSSDIANLILFNWEVKTATEGILHIFCRNQSALLKCLYSLDKFLPPYCKMKYLKLNREGDLSDSFASFLEKELFTLRDSLSSLAAENKRKRNLTSEGRCPVPASPEFTPGLEQYREQFEQDQKLNKAGMSLFVNENDYSQVMGKILGAQKDTNKVVWQLSQSQMNLDILQK